MVEVFSTSYRVAWVDTDAAGVVHFTNFFRMFERAEEDFYLSLGFSFKDIAERYGVWFPRVEAFCRYKSPAYFGDLLTIKLRIMELGEKHVKYRFRVMRKEELLAEGYVVVVAAEKERNVSTRIPDDVKMKLQPYVSER